MRLARLVGGFVCAVPLATAGCSSAPPEAAAENVATAEQGVKLNTTKAYCYGSWNTLHVGDDITMSPFNNVKFGGPLASGPISEMLAACADRITSDKLWLKNACVGLAPGNWTGQTKVIMRSCFKPNDPDSCGGETTTGFLMQCTDGKLMSWQTLDGDVASPSSTPTKPIYRFTNPAHADDNFYTDDTSEGYDRGYTLEEMAFHLDPVALQGDVPVYRCVLPFWGNHTFLTTSATCETPDNDLVFGFDVFLERALGYAPSAPLCSSVPAQRLNLTLLDASPQFTNHFVSIDERQIGQLLAQGWSLEGSQFFAFRKNRDCCSPPKPGSVGGKTCGGKKVCDTATKTCVVDCRKAKPQKPACPAPLVCTPDSPRCQGEAPPPPPAPTTCQPGLGGAFISDGNTWLVTIMQPALDTVMESEIRLDNDMSILAESSFDVGHEALLANIAAGDEAVFSILVHETGQRFFSGPAERNPDGLPHAKVDCLADGGARFSFEDQLGGGDNSFENVVFEVHPELPSD
jgi:hypothetical protein